MTVKGRIKEIGAKPVVKAGVEAGVGYLLPRVIHRAVTSRVEALADKPEITDVVMILLFAALPVPKTDRLFLAGGAALSLMDHGLKRVGIELL